MNHSKFFEKLNLDLWLINAGKRLPDKVNSKKPPKQNVTLKQAVATWKDDYDNRCDQWEELRIQLVNNKEWSSGFYAFREEIFAKLDSKKAIKDFAERLKVDFNIKKDEFYSELPVIGGWGEFLLGIESGYYSSQFEYFDKGFWLYKPSKQNPLFW